MWVSEGDRSHHSWLACQTPSPWYLLRQRAFSIRWCSGHFCTQAFPVWPPAKAKSLGTVAIVDACGRLREEALAAGLYGDVIFEKVGWGGRWDARRRGGSVWRVSKQTTEAQQLLTGWSLSFHNLALDSWQWGPDIFIAGVPVSGPFEPISTFDRLADSWASRGP